MSTKKFIDIPHSKLVEGVVEMCKYLGISGSAGYYNLYDAVLKEQERVKKLYKELQKVDERRV